MPSRQRGGRGGVTHASTTRPGQHSIVITFLRSSGRGLDSRRRSNGIAHAAAVPVNLTRLQLPRSLRVESQRVDALADLVRAAHETLEPRRVAAWLAGQLQVWLPLAHWSVLEDDLMGPPRILAADGLPEELEIIVLSIASRVIRLGEELTTANLQDHLVSAP